MELLRHRRATLDEWDYVDGQDVSAPSSICAWAAQQHPYFTCICTHQAKRSDSCGYEHEQTVSVPLLPGEVVESHCLLPHCLFYRRQVGRRCIAACCFPLQPSSFFQDSSFHGSLTLTSFRLAFREWRHRTADDELCRQDGDICVRCSLQSQFLALGLSPDVKGCAVRRSGGLRRSRCFPRTGRPFPTFFRSE
jgi:hypothetical protein